MVRWSIEKLSAALGLVVVASCAGQSISEPSDDDDASRDRKSTGGTSSAEQGGTGGTAPTGMAVGGGPTPGTGATTGAGARSSSGGSAPVAGRANSSAGHSGTGHGGAGGGPPGMVSTAGEAGAPQAGETGEGGHGGDGPVQIPCFSNGAYGMRCADGNAYAQGPTYELVAGATTVPECLAACKARSDCKSVSAYFEFSSPHSCRIIHDSCEEVSKPAWAEEDGGRTLRKVCTGDTCTYESVGFQHCANESVGEALPSATSLDDCMVACDGDTSCTAVYDYFYLDEVLGHCFLNIGGCSEVINNFEGGYLYRRMCP